MDAAAPLELVAAAPLELVAAAPVVGAAAVSIASKNNALYSSFNTEPRASSGGAAAPGKTTITSRSAGILAALSVANASVKGLLKNNCSSDTLAFNTALLARSAAS